MLARLARAGHEPFRLPLFFRLLAGVQTLLGDTVWVGRFLVVCFSMAAIAATAACARLSSSRAGAVAAAPLLAVNPGYLGYSPVAMLGLYALLRRRPAAFWFSALLLGIGYFAVVVLLVTPRFNTMGRLQYLGWYAHLGETPGEILWTVLKRPLFVLENLAGPGKLAFLTSVYGELAFLPFLRPDVLLLAAPTLAMCLLSPRQTVWDIHHQYPAMLYPTAFIGVVMAITTLARLGAVTRRVAPATMVRSLAALVLAGNILPHLRLESPVWGWMSARKPPSFARAAKRLVDQVPPGAPVAATNLLGPYLARRERLYLIVSGHGFYTDEGLARADYALVDTRNAAEAPGLEALRSDPRWVLLKQDQALPAVPADRPRVGGPGASARQAPRGPVERRTLREVAEGVSCA